MSKAKRKQEPHQALLDAARSMQTLIRDVRDMAIAAGYPASVISQVLIEAEEALRPYKVRK